MDERAQGIALRVYPLTETSLIIRWLTREIGRISTVAKGARRAKSPFRGKLDLFDRAGAETRPDEEQPDHWRTANCPGFDWQRLECNFTVETKHLAGRRIAAVPARIPDLPFREIAWLPFRRHQPGYLTALTGSA